MKVSIGFPIPFSIVLLLYPVNSFRNCPILTFDILGLKKLFSFKSLVIIINGSLLGDYIYEFVVPTEGVYINNLDFSVLMFIKVMDYSDALDKPAVEIVPEPGTLIFLGLGSIVVIRRKNFINF